MAGKKGVIIKALKLKFHYKKGKRNENEKDCDRHNLPDNYDVVELLQFYYGRTSICRNNRANSGERFYNSQRVGNVYG